MAYLQESMRNLIDNYQTRGHVLTGVEEVLLEMAQIQGKSNDVEPRQVKQYWCLEE